MDIILEIYSLDKIMDELHQFISKQPCYEQHVIEIKRIYESRLFTILIPNIYEGFKSLYNIAEKFERKFEESVKNNPNVEKMSILVIFQKLIANLPNLTTHKIRGETDRIKTASRSADIFDELVKAVIKANIILMTYNVDYKRKDLIQTRYHESVVVHDFVHSCYIESARVFHGRPELFWTGYDSLTINQNKRLCYDTIENSIRESINLALPMKEILAEYLNNPYEMKEDIRIYVIGEPKSESKLDLDNHNLQKYPGIFGGNGEIIKRGRYIQDGDEEFMNAKDLINRDLGAYIGEHNQVGSLLESESDQDGFEPGRIDPGRKSNLSILLGTESDITRDSRVSAMDSLLDDDNDDNNDDNIPDITPAEPADNANTGNKSHIEGMNNMSDASNASHGSTASNSVMDGIKMVSLNTSMTGRGQAKSFFNETLPEATKKAEEYRQKMREKISSGDDDTPTKKSVIDAAKNESIKKLDIDSDKSDKNGIRIIRTAEPSKVDTSQRKPTIDIRTKENGSINTDDITTDNVEDLLNNILSTKK